MNKMPFLLAGAVVTGLFLGSMKAWAASPKDVVEQFVRLDVVGARLTPQGWDQADSLFTKHTEPSQPNSLVVIGRHYGVSQDTSRKDYFAFGYADIGHIDAATLRFMLTPVVPMVRYWYKGYAVTVPMQPGKMEPCLPCGGSRGRSQWRYTLQQIPPYAG